MGEFLYSAVQKSHSKPCETKQEENSVFIQMLGTSSWRGFKRFFVLLKELFHNVQRRTQDKSGFSFQKENHPHGTRFCFCFLKSFYCIINRKYRKLHKSNLWLNHANYFEANPSGYETELHQPTPEAPSNYKSLSGPQPFLWPHTQPLCRLLHSNFPVLFKMHLYHPNMHPYPRLKENFLSHNTSDTKRADFLYQAILQFFDSTWEQGTTV